MKLKNLILKLHQLKALNYSQLGAVMWPEIPANQAGAKLRNKFNQVQGNKITDADWELIEEKLSS